VETAWIRSSTRSSVSSIASSRWDTERTRRVSRSTSAADGMFSAPIATFWAATAFSRASKGALEGARHERVARQLLASLPSASSPDRWSLFLSPSS